ncbi:MAG: hypothetical protein LC799_14420, partial [Actinobacteria bacterium]|nr:hypothetical protein [Actinomycetota bacterium]
TGVTAPSGGGGGGVGTTNVSATSSEPGGTLTVSATGVKSPGASYTLRLSTTSANCPASNLLLGSSVMATAGGAINAVQRTIPANVSDGVRWLCWGGTDDSEDHTIPTSVTLF